MENEAQLSQGLVAKAPLDPLANYWGLSLFPQASSSSLTLPPSSSSSDPNLDLQAIHNHLRSMALQSPAKHMDQLKSIIDENRALFDSEISSDPKCDEENDVVAEEAEDFPRKRRPALGLKRSRFSLKPTKNPSIENLIPSLDIDKLKDPVEFFLAHERQENAKREIQKQMGVSVEPNQDNASTKPRQRRPGLLGNNQRPVRYRHRYPKETMDNNDHVPFSQEAIGSVSLGPVGENTDKVEACRTPLVNEVTDSSAVEETNKINDILGGLLGCNSEDLEGDGAITLLQERLQIKPIVLEQLSVPDFPDNQVIDLKSLHGSSSKPRKRKALSNIDNLLKGMNNRTPFKQDVGSVQQSASPTPPRSPFALLSSLQKHILRSKSSVDPFSAHEIDHLSARKQSPNNPINQELNLAGSGKLSNEPPECIIDDSIPVSMTSSVVDSVRNCASTSGKSKDDNSGMSSTKLNAPVIEVIVEVNETFSVEDTVTNCASTPQKSMKDNSREPQFDANIESSEPHVDIILDTEGSGMNGIVDRPNNEANGPNEVEDNVDNMQAHAASASTDDSNLNLVNRLDQSDPAGFQTDATDKCTRRADGGPEQCLQDKTDGNSMLPDNGRRRAKHSRKQYKEKSRRRQSLAAAGTSWKSGVRRSTRIRTRPLEYWKGERMVYGRVHQSLATVIGIKCVSPGSDGKPTMKVKSYVSDEYKELLELASLY